MSGKRPTLPPQRKFPVSREVGGGECTSNISKNIKGVWGLGQKLWLPLSNFIRYKTMDTLKTVNILIQHFESNRKLVETLNQSVIRFWSVHCYVLYGG